MRKGILYLCLMIGGLSSCSIVSNNTITEEVTQRKSVFNSDDEFLDFIQKAHLNYMWEGAEPNSGLACERIHIDNDYPENDSHIITTGGSGFGIAGLIVGIERGFISRKDGLSRFHKIADFLTKADRFHGVWPHWIDSHTGKVKPFGQKDNGGDLVESAFLMQGLLCARQYFNQDNESERSLVVKINKLWHEMEWSWYQNGKDVLYWHWSPDYAWEMNFPLEGYNECLITYILGASSPTYPISDLAYHKGWARNNGGIKSEAKPYDLPLELRHNGAEEKGGPLFWAHYSYIGLNPKGLKDQYADYWEVNKNHTLANYNHCVENPKGYAGYSSSCWGLTASYSVGGYDAHFPANDKGVITPTAALSSFPYTPVQSMAALKFFYNELGERLWGQYGFYDAFSIDRNWFLPRYLAIDQCTIAPMIENYRTGLLWNLFMSCPEVQNGLRNLGFSTENK